MVAASSFGYLQMVLGFIAGQLIIAYLLVPLFYKMNLVSIYEYLENRFGMSSYARVPGSSSSPKCSVPLSVCSSYA